MWSLESFEKSPDADVEPPFELEDVFLSLLCFDTATPTPTPIPIKTSKLKSEPKTLRKSANDYMKVHNDDSQCI